MDAGDEDKADWVDLAHLLRSAYRWRRTIISMTALGLLASATYAVLAQPVFTAGAQVMLEPSQARSLVEEENRTAITPDQARVESHIEIIKSEQLALEVIRNLQLATVAEFKAPADSSDKERYAASVLQRTLSARRIGQSLVIEVSFGFRDPALAAKITNALVDSYIAHEMQVKADAVERADNWLYDKQIALDKQTQAALAELESYRSAAGDQAADRSKLNELSNRAQILQRMHDAYLQKFNEAIQKVSFPEPDVRLISPAMAPLRKSYPPRGLIVALGTLIGLGLGVITAAVRQNLDRSLRLPAQLGPEGACFGTVSEFPTNCRLSPRAARKEARAKVNGRNLATYGTNPVMRLVADNPSSRAAAEFRDIQVSLECAMDAKSTRLVGVVAATQGEGATTIAANLAAVYALEGLRAGVIDLRRDGMQTAGQVLKWARAESSRAQSSSVDHSNVTALGTVHVNGNLATVGGLGERLQPAADPENVRHYEAVVFDFPGLRTSADARAMARFLDAMIVVAQAGVTPLDAVHAAVRALRSAGAPVVGVVLNKAGSG